MMFYKTRHLFVCLALGFSIVTCSGCMAVLAGAAAGAGGYAWTQGSLVKEFDTTAQKLREAGVKGLKSLDMPVDYDQGDRLSALVRSSFSDGKSVKINISALTERTAKIKIRVGLFGDKLRSEMILNSIQKHI